MRAAFASSSIQSLRARTSASRGGAGAIVELGARTDEETAAGTLAPREPVVPPLTYFKPKKAATRALSLGGLDDDVAVTLTSGVQLPATVRTVGALRRLMVWPTKHRLVIERHPVIEVRVESGYAAHHA